MKKPMLSIDADWTFYNWHRTRGVGGLVERMYTPRNRWADGSTQPEQAFLPGLRGLQQIVKDAEADHKQLRALGSGWSLNNIAYTDDYLVNTARLSDLFVGFKTTSMLTEPFRPHRQHLVFAQCGTQIKTLNSKLERVRLCLPTSGASNGQTIAGAVSTGTHGSAHDVGGMQDFVLGLHMVGAGGKHYFIQRASRPVVSQDFCTWLDRAELVNDDDLFRAAVVGFGSFGLLHAVLFQAEPVYLLERHIARHDYAEVILAAQTLDVSSLDLPHGNTLPFHFEIVLNPYRLLAGEKGARVRVYYKRPASELLPVASFEEEESIFTEDLVAMASGVSDAIPELVPSLLESQLDDAVHVTPPRGITGTPAQQFQDTTQTNGGTSIEVGFPLSAVGQALGIILGVAQREVLGAPLALRYVKASDAFLACTRFSPTTCAMEMPGIDSNRARRAHQAIFRELAQSGIPHAYHWGQQLPRNASWVSAAFGSRRQQWIDARASFLDPAARKMFSNSILEACGLTG
jgi:FAD/FMN-containing dehydrogenase